MTETLAALKRHWGYDDYRPLQREAIEAVCAGRDSLVVLPTGGGKSLCFQVPAVTRPRYAVVVSPLISLMKDQVDGLRANGIAAACVNSAVPLDEQRAVADQIRAGELDLLYVAPERLVRPKMIRFLREHPPQFFAIDEAHCISMWGHEFRPEYRALERLRDEFPDLAIHAYTATATPRVRDDIRESLRLQDPAVLVGSFDRPNLHYHFTERRGRGQGQVEEILDRHPDASGIIYCVTRKQVMWFAEKLRGKGHLVLPYHAGLDSALRKAYQEAFTADRAKIVVATVAFGMGIDKPDVRFVIHTGLPKSPEHYQQESGRAGRDGLPAECHLLHARFDLELWERILRDTEEPARSGALERLAAMHRLAHGRTCRHQALVGQFGEDLATPCGAMCDVCQPREERVATRTDTRKARRRRDLLATVGDGVDDDLFEALRTLRTDLARRQGRPPYAVFGDRSLLDMARRRPSSQEAFLQIHGVGRAKARAYGETFLSAILDHCSREGLSMDVEVQ